MKGMICTYVWLVVPSSTNLVDLKPLPVPYPLTWLTHCTFSIAGTSSTMYQRLMLELGKLFTEVEQLTQLKSLSLLLVIN